MNIRILIFLQLLFLNCAINSIAIRIENRNSQRVMVGISNFPGYSVAVEPNTNGTMTIPVGGTLEFVFIFYGFIGPTQVTTEARKVQVISRPHTITVTDPNTIVFTPTA